MRLQANIVENKSRGIVENESLGKSLAKVQGTLRSPIVQILFIVIFCQNVMWYAVIINY